MNNDLKKENEKLKDLLLIIRHYTEPLCIWYDEQTKCYNLKGCSKQEVYETFYKIREIIKGNRIFLTDEEFLKELIEENENHIPHID